MFDAMYGRFLGVWGREAAKAIAVGRAFSRRRIVRPARPAAGRDLSASAELSDRARSASP
jgi:hypothetical protein